MKKFKLIVTLLIFVSALVSCKCLKSKGKMTDLENTSWTLIQSGNKIYVKNSETPDGILLSFENGNFSTTDGCNTVGGEFTSDKNNITFDKIRNTMRYCDQEFMQKYGYAVAFFSAKKFEIKEDKLFLFEEDGKTLVAEYIKK